MAASRHLFVSTLLLLLIFGFYDYGLVDIPFFDNQSYVIDRLSNNSVERATFLLKLVILYMLCSGSQEFS